MNSIGNQGGRGYDFEATWNKVKTLLEGFDPSIIDQAKTIWTKAKYAKTVQDKEVFLCELGMFVRGLVIGKKTYASG